MNETIAILIGFILTLFIYSYVLGDNVLYRLAIYLLVGVSAAYAAVVVVTELFLPLFRRLSADPAAPENLLWLAPLALAFLLLLTWLRPVAWLGNSSVGALVGVGAAVALVGAVGGTLIPQVMSGGDNALLGVAVALLTALTLLYFQFTGTADLEGVVLLPAWQRAVVSSGRVVLTITFAALFAGLLATSIALLSERVSYFVTWLLAIAGGL